MEEIKAVAKDGIYYCDTGISVDEWKEIIQDNTLMKANYKDALIKFYNEPEHKSTCKDLGEKYNISPQTINALITAFAKVVQKRLNRFKVIDNDGKPTFFPIVMTGRGVGGYYEWTLRPELAKAIEETNFYKEELLQSNVNKYISLVKSNRNLILTGAPGIGKTYLAKQIAEEVIKGVTEKVDAIDVVHEAISSFKVDENLRENQQTLLEEFRKQFPIENLDKLTLEEYCTGRSGEYPDNFCNRIENGLKKLGGFMPGSAIYYRIYWDKLNDSYCKSGFVVNDSDEDAIRKVANKLKQLVIYKDFLDFTQFFGVGFALKILNTYYPDEFFPINSKNHIDNVLKLFDIDCSGDYSEKNKAIFNFYKKIIGDYDITPFEFMSILYSNFNIRDGELKDNDNMVITSGEYNFVQFHPSYDYTDFVEGLRPKKDEGQKEIGFELKNGVFKDFCKKAKDNPNKNYVFIIDEINRGEISKIFGELFFSIDPGYRGKKGIVKTQYANIQTEKTRFSEDLEDGCFYVPENVYIIGTMNDIDRSVESFDFAMRRRFTWVEIKAKESAENMNLSEVSMKKMNALNDEIEKIEGLNSSYHIGAAYFLKLENYDNDYQKLWDLRLRPLLFEYLRGMSDADGKLEMLRNAYLAN